MRSFIAPFSLILTLALLVQCNIDLDENDNLNEDQFEEAFNKRAITDPVEKAKREAQLKKTEDEVREENEDYEKGRKTWYAAVNEFSDMTLKELNEEITGAKLDDFDRRYSTGAIQSTDETDEPSQRYLEMLKSRRSAPPSYDARKLGLVSPVQHQHNCGCCTAFATVAAYETCIKKATGKFGDFAEQQLIDCAYGKHGAKGCSATPYEAYSKWITNNNISLTHESNHPYVERKSTYRCPSNLPPYNLGARVTSYVYKNNYYKEDEEALKQMVFKHGAVIAGVDTNSGGLFKYKGGIYDECRGNFINHAVTVVGYGTEGGVDFWIAKNSWGKDWGEQGFFRLKRGVGMCGIGKALVGLVCERVPGPTSSPLKPVAPCWDVFTNCDKYVRENNCHSHQENCKKSCGLCEGMTPHPSNTCWDEWPSCPYKCDTSRKKECKYSCGLCGANSSDSDETAPDCEDKMGNCDEIKSWACKMDDWKVSCKKTCGLCGSNSSKKARNPDCKDKMRNCDEIKSWACKRDDWKVSCKKSCNLC